MDRTEIIIVRHGESQGNAARIMLGHTDLDLTERGLEQANATAEFLKDTHIDVIYSSDLCRAYHTAEPHAKLRGLAILTDQGLRETYVGKWENVPFPTIAEDDAENYEHWRREFGTMEFPQGESTYGSGMRFYETVLKIARENLGKTVMIATHAGVLRAFWGIINGYDKKEMGDAFPFATNASCSYVTYDGERLVPGQYSVNSHLESIGFLTPGKQ